MAKIGRSCGWMAWPLLIVLAACGDNVTQSTGDLVTADANEPAPNVSGVPAVPPTLVLTTANGWGELHTPPGFSPPAGPGYSLILQGENFSTDWNGTAYIYVIFRDGTEMPLAWGSGRGPDGSYKMITSANCPSRLREAWAVIVSKGRTFESKHIVPAC